MKRICLLHILVFPVQLVLLIGLFIAGFDALPVEAAITLESPRTLTFKCAEQDQNTPGWPNGCDGLEAGGDQKLPFPCQLISAANYTGPGAGGGLGSRTWWSATKNVMCGAPNMAFAGGVGPGEAWIRWYQRFEPGWHWPYGDETRAQKNIYLGTVGNSHSIWFEFTNGYTRIVVDNRVTVPQPPPLTNMFRTEHGGGSDTSNGAWACHEVHWKGETTLGAANGELDWWTNGKLYLHSSTVTLGFTATGGLGYNHGSLPSNGIADANRYQDVDEIAISTTGRIGCLSGADLTPPTSPSNLRVN